MHLMRPEVTALLDSRVKGLPNTCYKLAGAGVSQYAYDTVLPEELTFDENRMSIWIPYASGVRRDGVGDLLEVSGIRTERHRKLPVVLFDHGKIVTLPIAMSAERDASTGRYDYTKYYNEIDPTAQAARLNAFFYQGKGGLRQIGTDGASALVPKKEEYDHAVFCEQLYDMAIKGLLSGGSIGYQIIQAKHLAADNERGTPPGLHLLSVLMLEGSLVVMPANMDTVRKTLCMPAVCGKPLSPYLVKSLSPYAAPAKAQLGWEPRPSKDIVPVPHTGHSRQNVPPARWKPGAGALKELRAKYRQKGYESNQRKIAVVMREFKEGKLRSSSGEKVTDRKQALAIALAKSGRSNKAMSAYAETSGGALVGPGKQKRTKILKPQRAIDTNQGNKSLYIIRQCGPADAPVWSGYDWTRTLSNTLGFMSKQEAEKVLEELKKRNPKLQAVIEPATEQKNLPHPHSRGTKAMPDMALDAKAEWTHHIKSLRAKYRKKRC